MDRDLLKTMEQSLQKRLEECTTSIPQARGKERQYLINEHATLKKRHDKGK